MKKRGQKESLDYYPYGLQMPARTFTAQTYRYAYQGSEQALEYSQAGGNVYTTFFRTLDSRLGRWTSPDVVSQPWQSPYSSMDNNPVALVDPWGAQSDGGDVFNPNKKINPRTGLIGPRESQNTNFTITFDPAQLIGNFQQTQQAQNYFTMEVQPNTTLGGIAEEYGTTVEDIKEVNPDIDWEGEREGGDLIYAGEELKIHQSQNVVKQEEDSKFYNLNRQEDINDFFEIEPTYRKEEFKRKLKKKLKSTVKGIPEGILLDAISRGSLKFPLLFDPVKWNTLDFIYELRARLITLGAGSSVLFPLKEFNKLGIPKAQYYLQYKGKGKFILKPINLTTDPNNKPTI